MALAQLKTLSTLEEYLALEREAEVRHEYLDGEIYETDDAEPEAGAS